ncbi:SDR family NAD(P)-dependent oxidoreductase [Nocardia asteroides]|uniref:SDR family NAD(P)-dependent oxidoreductase n=1 Tax=Nocardia asteroides TaxID=1824 RepID=UPI00365C5179
MNPPLRGRTLVMPGGSRGAGTAIALAAARQGAHIVFDADPADAGPVVAGIEAAGGQALVVGALRDEAGVGAAIDAVVARFGGIDIVVDNTDAVEPGAPAVTLAEFEDRQQCRLRATLLVTRAALPLLRRSNNPHILAVAPPLNLAGQPRDAQSPSMLATYGMTLLTLGFASELRAAGIAANCLWPHALPATVALGPRPAPDFDPPALAAAAVRVLAGRAAVDSGETHLDVDVLGDPDPTGRVVDTVR